LGGVDTDDPSDPQTSRKTCEQLAMARTFHFLAKANIAFSVVFFLGNSLRGPIPLCLPVISLLRIAEGKMSNRLITQEEVEEAIKKMRFPRPKLSSDEAVRKGLALFNERPEDNHCAPSIVAVLQEAYDLPGGKLPVWISTGFRGGMCVGEVCGALSGAIMALGLMAYKVLEPRTDHEQRVASQAIVPYVRDLLFNFNYTFGSIHCARLTKRDERTAEETEIYFRTRLSKDVCSRFVEFVLRKMVNWGEVSQRPPERILPGSPPLRLA
jgi:C_GCAxxG_C_C family probable redox protein